MATRLNDPLILEKIEKFIKPLNPPVFSFEKSIRETPFKILISVLLSSRTKDDVTREASNNLFKTADSPEKMLELGEKKISELIFPVGFFNQKAKNIIKISKILKQKRKIPDNYSGLVALPGVGRKTANLVLAHAFDKYTIAVDTHVFRISRRLGWAKGKKPEHVESELQKKFPREYWKKLNQVLVGFGQSVCKPVKPSCTECILKQDCPFFKKSRISDK